MGLGQSAETAPSEDSTLLSFGTNDHTTAMEAWDWAGV
jgi:hypothetical protein